MIKVELLSGGEKAAYAKGLEIINENQMAVCYLAALSRTKGAEVNFGINKNCDLCIEAGINPETYRRMVNRFEILLEDKADDEDFKNGEILYPKVINYYTKFSEMKRDEVTLIAQESFTIENKQKGQELYDASIVKTKKYSETKKQVDEKIKFQLVSLFNSFKKVGFDYDKAKSNAIIKVATEFKVDKLETTRIFNLAKI